MYSFKYFFSFIIITLFGFLYEKYKFKEESKSELEKYDKVKNFLFNDSSIFSGKPILWVHNDYAINSRSWPSFFSRNTKHLNQPYLQLCIESIVRHCGDSFHVCIIDDQSFSKLIPGWKVDMNRLPRPLLNHIRTLGTTKLLYYYGGLLIPNSTLVLKDLYPIYKNSIDAHDVFTFECVDRNSTSVYTAFFPDIRLLGCKKQTRVIKSLVSYLDKKNLSEFTSESDFLGQSNRWLFEKCQNKEMGLVKGNYIGTRTIHDKPVFIDDLLGESYIPYEKSKLCAIYIPGDEILKRTKYEWFARLSPEQVLKSGLLISKYILMSQA